MMSPDGRKWQLIYPDLSEVAYSSANFLQLKVLMEQHALKNENNCLNTNIYSYLETSGG
jgi:hypothetical protein